MVRLIAAALAGTPLLYATPAYESPVRGDPDDLLLISGVGLSAGDTVVYQQLGDTTLVAQPPASVPQTSTASVGVADLVSAADAPYSLTIHLPAVMTAGRAYGLWVVTPDNQWSTEVRINDARPLWITPDTAYQSASLANLPRLLKVVGRNLQPDPTAGATTQVRLTGVNTGTTYTLTASNTDSDPGKTAALERYVAAVNLPVSMAVDQYSVQVSRDGMSWAPLLGNGQSAPQTLTVNSDPAPPDPTATYSVSDPRFADPTTGQACQPNDDVDDTACIVLAIRAAQMAGGGTVRFDPGTWLLNNAGTWSGPSYSNRTGIAAGSCPGYAQTCGVGYQAGIVMPIGVSLQGAGATGPNATQVQRGTGWPIDFPLFTLQGSNLVSGFDFTDANNYLSNYANQIYSGSPQLQLGLRWNGAHAFSFTDPLTASNIVITNNLFDKPWYAIASGAPIDHVYITYNTFGGAWVTAIRTSQDENSVQMLRPNSSLPYVPFHWDDTIISHNTFYPSSFQVTPAAYNSGAPGGNGVIATQLNTARREDFSDNVADGTATQYLYSPTDPKGWRAAFFWSIGANTEMTLVSNNTITCSADKYGDGESIVYDGSMNLGGMPAAQPVIAAATWTDNGIAGTTLTVQGSVATQLPTSGGTVDISSTLTAYYHGYWLQVVAGAGKGQWRKVVSLSLGSNAVGPTVTLNVTPAMDIMPDASSQVVLDRAYWQNLTVNNSVDQRSPLCTNANTRGDGGTMSWYASTGDSAMEGNRLYNTSGIFLHHNYQPVQAGATTVNPAPLALKAYDEVHGNLVSGAR
jgi:hypothetical protein